jgi:hypothetical protein
MRETGEIGEIKNHPSHSSHLKNNNHRKEDIMTSKKQILANPQNAKASTGPVTIEGKAVVATNAIKHGIFTKDLIITSGPG